MVSHRVGLESAHSLARWASKPLWVRTTCVYPPDRRGGRILAYSVNEAINAFLSDAGVGGLSPPPAAPAQRTLLVADSEEDDITEMYTGTP